MSTRQRLENIIIGTLLDNNNHYEDVRGYVTEDMFRDTTCRRIFGLITEMRNDGAGLTDPYSIYQRYGMQVADIIPQMCQLCTDYSFDFMKLRYNEERYLDSLLFCCTYRTTNVEFIDYVTKFVNIVIEDEKRGNEHTTGSAA